MGDYSPDLKKDLHLIYSSSECMRTCVSAVWEIVVLLCSCVPEAAVPLFNISHFLYMLTWADLHEIKSYVTLLTVLHHFHNLSTGSGGDLTRKLHLQARQQPKTHQQSLSTTHAENAALAQYHRHKRALAHAQMEQVQPQDCEGDAQSYYFPGGACI